MRKVAAIKIDNERLERIIRENGGEEAMKDAIGPLRFHTVTRAIGICVAAGVPVEEVVYVLTEDPIKIMEL